MALGLSKLGASSAALNIWCANSRLPADSRKQNRCNPQRRRPAPFQALEDADLRSFRARYAFPHEKIVYSVGRIVQEKGIETLIEAAPLVLAEIPASSSSWRAEGPNLDYLRRMVGEMNLASKVMLAGFISDQERNRLFLRGRLRRFPQPVRAVRHRGAGGDGRAGAGGGVRGGRAARGGAARRDGHHHLSQQSPNRAPGALCTRCSTRNGRPCASRTPIARC